MEQRKALEEGKNCFICFLLKEEIQNFKKMCNLKHVTFEKEMDTFKVDMKSTINTVSSRLWTIIIISITNFLAYGGILIQHFLGKN